jgi:hypothetical protein
VLRVGLTHFDGEPEVLADAYAQVGEVGVGGLAVDVDLAGAEATQVRSIEDVHVHELTSW